MEDAIQRLLDEQWDSLESRAHKEVKRVRRELYETIVDLGVQRDEEVVKLDAEIEQDRRFIQSEKTFAVKRDETLQLLAAESASELHKSLEAVESEVASLDEQIKQLQEKRDSLETERRKMASTYSSRTAKLQDYLSDLEKSHPKENAQLLEATQQRLAKQQEQRDAFRLEAAAASNGASLWLKVCEELDSLDKELKGLKRDQLSQIAFLVSQTVKTVEGRLEEASENGWSILTVAIGHELQILHDTQTAVQKAIYSM